MRCVSCRRENPPGLDRCEGCGAGLSEAGADLDSRVLALLDRGQKIEAIKLYREATGAGLKEAKDAVEGIERGVPSSAARGDAGDLDHELASLLQQGRKIEAIKLYRSRTAAGLKEAKEAVEDLAARNGIVAAGGGSGCLGAILVLVALLGASVWTL